ncbi:hypothetical protein HYZ97_00495 [Candidatus Pacearchaeota archaeon]|nr:hypothetical protein [Candidatus Pacearchaeota archaeon]
MEFKKNLVSLVAVFAVFALLASTVSAFATITSVEVSGVEGINGSANIAAFAGQTLPVRVIFTAQSNASDVRVKAWISGDRDYSAASERFDVIAGNTYSRLMAVNVPFDIDPSESMTLQISVESQTVEIRSQVALRTQRESYIVEILDAVLDPTVTAGDNLAVDVILKNRGRQTAEDTFVRVSIPALSIERRAYFGDLTPVDQANPDKEDASERRMLISIPAGTPAGIYTVTLEAYNADSTTTVSKKIAVVGASGDSRVVASATTKTFGLDETGVYTVTLVNTGSRVRVYDVSFDAPSGLMLEADESVFAVPAGTSKSIKVNAEADKAGAYTFVVNVNSDGELVKRESFVANVEGTKRSAANATVVLTVVLAIIFVVLLVVLIVLLTRKPQKTEEFGESYY